jgi:hypothetical protein
VSPWDPCLLLIIIQTEHKLREDHLDLIRGEAEANRVAKIAEAKAAAAKVVKIVKEKRAADDAKLEAAIKWACFIFATFIACAGFVLYMLRLEFGHILGA